MLNIRFVGIIPSIDVRPEGPWSDKSDHQRLIAQRRNIQACIDRIKEVQFLIRQQMSRSRLFGFGLDFLFSS
jgi:ABC-type lipoprotein release transport system permease subunit